MVDNPQRRTGAAAAVLTIGVLAISSAAIFIRISAASALVTAFYRLLLSTSLMWAAVGLRPRLHSAIPWRVTVPAGIALAAHFALWMASLDVTSVLVSTLFVTTTPLWLALAARFLPDEPTLTRRGWAGLCLALGGAALLAIADGRGAAIGDRTLVGAALATGGAWAMAAFLALSGRARRTTPFLPFSAAATTVAAVTLALPIVLTKPELTGFPGSTWLAIAALALFPQIIGHNSFVWGVRFVGATTVALAALMEPVASGMLAFLFFDERPTLLHAAAAVILLAGLTLVLRSRVPNARAA